MKSSGRVKNTTDNNDSKDCCEANFAVELTPHSKNTGRGLLTKILSQEMESWSYSSAYRVLAWHALDTRHPQHSIKLGMVLHIYNPNPGQH